MSDSEYLKALESVFSTLTELLCPMASFWFSRRPDVDDWSQTLVFMNEGIVRLRYEEPEWGAGYAPEFTDSDKLAVLTRIVCGITDASAVILYSFERLLSACPTCKRPLVMPNSRCKSCQKRYRKPPRRKIPSSLFGTHIVAEAQLRCGVTLRMLVPAMARHDGERDVLGDKLNGLAYWADMASLDLSRPWRRCWLKENVYVPPHLRASYWANYLPLYKRLTAALPPKPVRASLANRRLLTVGQAVAPLCVDGLCVEFFQGCNLARIADALVLQLRLN